MVAQYKSIKAQHKDKILFFRLGDFYEMFFADAEIAARELEITLTARDAGKGKRMPMCGVPYHAAENYIARLLDKGYKIAICEQVEDPKASTGLVKREVVRIITPGTFFNPQNLEAKKNNYLVSVVRKGDSFGLAVVDAGTGEFQATAFYDSEPKEALQSELMRLQPIECLYPQKDPVLAQCIADLQHLFPCMPTPQENMLSIAESQELLLSRVSEANLPDEEPMQLGVWAAGALLNYLEETQKVELIHISNLDFYHVNDYMVIDGATQRNLELTKSIRDDQTKTTLLGVLDYTCTAMGGRTLRHWLEQPLINVAKIKERQDIIDTLLNDSELRSQLYHNLKHVYDLERLLGKVVYQTATARDLLSLRKSLKLIPDIKCSLTNVSTKGLCALEKELDPCQDLYQLLEQALEDAPPVGLKDGNLIKSGFDQEVDRLRQLTLQGKEWLAQLETKERERTGIKSLKIGYNKIFGYYLEVTRSNLAAVPADYIRKQTLVNAERFITPELKEWEAEITGAQARCLELEYEIFIQIRKKIAQEAPRLQATARVIGQLDAFQSLAQAALYNRYIKPEVSNKPIIKIEAGRHPVVEKIQTDTPFVPNDTMLDNDNNQLIILTGPNMAGKSTYIRQVALLVLMAQVGSFIPAKSAHIGIVDRIFTRIGASDNLAAGESTFMVEMKEVGSILRNASKKSLIILDEIGRGTSTYDGLSIARAVAEYIIQHKNLGAKTLFATHYHELTELAAEYPQVKNYTIGVEEQGKDIIFLRKIIPGISDKSYGIHVARLAKLPEAVIIRAGNILTALEAKDTETQVEAAAATDAPIQLDLFSAVERQVLEQLLALDPENMTPLQALGKIYQLQALLKNN
ncbi:MAG: DNA mismatch repair protein MutS [bacterium]